MIYVVDTNIIIYFLKGLLSVALPEGRLIVSVISEIELLLYPEIPPDDEQLIREFLATVTLADLTPAVREAAIQLGRSNRLKTPDAAIVATARVYDAELLTNDARLLGLPGVRSRELPMIGA